MSRVLPHPLLSAILVVLWLLLVNSVSPGQLLLGLLLGWLIPMVTCRFWDAEARIRRSRVLVRLAGVVLLDILVANGQVAIWVMRPARHVRPGFVRMPLQLRSDIGVSLLANIVSLTPGTLSAYLSADRAELVIHALQADDPDRIIAEIRERYEQPLIEALTESPSGEG